jgi:peptidoglycan/LPS O-acetylase OafA/YrhL
MSSTPTHPSESPRGDWRSEVAGASGANLIVGIWLILSPWIVNYQSDDSWWNPIVFGAAVGVLALARVAGLYRESWLSVVNAVIGLWLFASAFWLADSTQASWNVGVCGILVFALAAWSAAASGAVRHSNRGRRSDPGAAH